ncbi:hypothetical protein [Streptomyces sp. NPDC093970]|uniref:hypothetical protein n=1 Tax=Streptomyces sp. NPDC093970 TaxID=3155076 RepID=UPI00341996BB
MPTATCVGERVHLVHGGYSPPDRLVRLCGLLTPVRQGEAVVVVGTPLPDGKAEEVCRRLRPAPDSGRDAQVRLLVLLMTQGANGRSGGGSVAQLICERWGLAVLAAAGSALVPQDGFFFSPGLPGASGGWWHFPRGSAQERGQPPAGAGLETCRAQGGPARPDRPSDGDHGRPSEGAA